MPKHKTFFHANSLEAKADARTLSHINRSRRRADIDLSLKIRWANRGFVSVPGNLGPRDGDSQEDDEG